MGTLTVPADANAVTPGGAMTASFVLAGTMNDETPPFVCGALTGAISAPVNVDLAGSTFTMQRIDGSVPFPVISCAKDPAMYN